MQVRRMQHAIAQPVFDLLPLQHRKAPFMRRLGDSPVYLPGTPISRVVAHHHPGCGDHQHSVPVPARPLERPLHRIHQHLYFLNMLFARVSVQEQLAGGLLWVHGVRTGGVPHLHHQQIWRLCPLRPLCLPRTLFREDPFVVLVVGCVLPVERQLARLSEAREVAGFALGLDVVEVVVVVVMVSTAILPLVQLCLVIRGTGVRDEEVGGGSGLV
mmetsp:Transcript_3610/g.8176  ORF Transcript_3610/g.8176 Transcript_3610/m.8176 type:complete len:214 (+) Transcript_3610:309-950(+)